MVLDLDRNPRGSCRRSCPARCRQVAIVAGAERAFGARTERESVDLPCRGRAERTVINSASTIRRAFAIGTAPFAILDE